MRAHEAGALHAEGYGGPPHWLPWPADVKALLPPLWPQTVRRDGSGRLEVGGVDVVTLASEYGTAAYVVDEDDFRARARAFSDAFDGAVRPVCGGVDVYYAGKAFLCTAVARWVAEEGLLPRRLLRRRARGGAAGRLPRGADRHARQQQEPRRDPAGARVRRRPDHRRLVRGDRAHRRRRNRSSASQPP